MNILSKILGKPSKSDMEMSLFEPVDNLIEALEKGCTDCLEWIHRKKETTRQGRSIDAYHCLSRAKLELPFSGTYKDFGGDSISVKFDGDVGPRRTSIGREQTINLEFEVHIDLARLSLELEFSQTQYASLTIDVCEIRQNSRTRKLTKQEKRKVEHLRSCLEQWLDDIQLFKYL